MGCSALTPIAPPFDRATVGLLSAVISLFIIAAVFLSHRPGQRKHARTLKYLFVAFLVGLLSYLLLHTGLIFKSEVLKVEVIRGLWCNPEKAIKISALAARCPLLSERDLQGQDFDLDFFWTPGSVLASKNFLLGIWFTLVTVLSASAAQFALATRKAKKS